MKVESNKKNFIFQFIYQFIVLVIPLIVSPYLTRTLGENGLGNYTFSNVFAYYFVVVAMLGINKYGQRIIAENGKDEISLRKTFWSLFILHSIVSALVTLIYIILVFSINFENDYLYVIQIFYVISALFDITWLFYGLQNFKSVVIRNAIIKILELIFIFIFVKSIEDLWIYALIKSLSSFLSQLIMIPFAVKSIKFIKFSFSDMVIHIKPLLLFTIFVVASLFYTVLDKTLLGLLSTKENVAYYEYANKIIDIPKNFAYIIGTVIFPKACSIYNKGESSFKLERYLNVSLDIVYFITVGSFFGLFIISDNLAVIYYGENFKECGEIMRYLSLVTIIVCLSNIIESLFIIPKKKDKQLVIIILGGGICNLIISTICIYYFGLIGAVIGTISAEAIKLFVELFLCKEDLKIYKVFMAILPHIFAGIVMALIIWVIKLYMPVNYVGLIVEILVGALVYCVLISIYLFLFSVEKKYYCFIVSTFLHKIFRRSK